jgi:hypothetical protein
MYTAYEKRPGHTRGDAASSWRRGSWQPGWQRPCPRYPGKHGCESRRQTKRQAKQTYCSHVTASGLEEGVFLQTKGQEWARQLATEQLVTRPMLAPGTIPGPPTRAEPLCIQWRSVTALGDTQGETRRTCWTGLNRRGSASPARRIAGVGIHTACSRYPH